MKVHRSDVAILSFDGVNIMAGDVLFAFFASAPEWGECAFVTAWNQVVGQPGFWKFEVLDDIVRVPIRNLCGSATAHIGAKHATLPPPPTTHPPPTPCAERWLMLVSCSAMQNITVLIGDVMRRDTAPEEVL